MTRDDFITLVARMTIDGEEADGVEYVQEADDAIKTLGDLIELARSIRAQETQQ
jgi:hypothetical protein